MTVNLEQVVFDCGNPLTLAAFWSAVLEQPVDPGGSESYATVGRTGDYPLPTAFMFIRVPEGRTGKNRLHVDLTSVTPEVDVARAVAHGAAVVAEIHEHGIRWTTLTDPEGNVFDIAFHAG